MEDEIPDLKASQIIEHSIRPFLNEGNLFAAIQAYYVESQKAIDGSVIDSIWHRIEQGGESSDIVLVVAFILGWITGKIVSI
ncbi:MAG: hypothetical protein LBP53_03115 [Candidatus Peribacteria bacterium]|nr:hypothetical protein [Candidatus Peribacteria bacterium]